MSGIFNSPYQYDSNFIEATVTNVDPIRFCCSVRTIGGQFLNEVQWLLPTGGSGKSGTHFSPCIGDQVVICASLSYPVIFGSLPRVGLPAADNLGSTGAELGVDPGASGSLRNGYTLNPNKPQDFAPGDNVNTNDSGGVFGLLANGSAVIKASPLAQILVSKFDDLVRIIARNFERISDVGQQTAANVSGRMYEFFGWDRDFNRSKNALYELQDVIGDVAAGETLKSDPSPDVTIPPRDVRVRKYWLTAAGADRMVETLEETGKLTLVVTNTGTTTVTQDGSLWSAQSVDGTTSTVTITPTSITVDHGGVSKALFDSSQVKVNHGGAVTVYNSSGINSTFGSHFIKLDSGGIHLG